MSIEHKDIVDGERHEPKGAGTAVLDTVLKSDGDGTTSWVSVDTLIPEGATTMERVLEAFNPSTSAEPSGVDIPLQIPLGNAQFTPSDPVMLANDGTVTFNEAGLYHVRVSTQYGRTGGAGEARLHARSLANGVQIGDTLSATLDAASTLIPLSVQSWVTVPAGTTFTYEVIRDSSGNNSGGLFAGPVSAAGWTDSPCASIRVERLVHV